MERKPFSHPTAKVIINIPDPQQSPQTGPDQVAIERQKRLEETKLTPIAQMQAELNQRNQARANQKIVRGIIGGTVGALALATGIIVIHAKTKADHQPELASSGVTSTSGDIDLPSATAFPGNIPANTSEHPEPVAPIKPEPSVEPSATAEPAVEPITTATASATASVAATPSVKPAYTAPKWQNKQPPKPNTGGIMREVPF